MRGFDANGIVRLAVTVGASLLTATLLVALVEEVLGVPRPSAIYLVAVVASALVAGTTGAIAASVGAFLLDDYLFVDPRGTLMATEVGVWLSLLVLLFAGIVVGHLVAMQRRWTETARTREREAATLFELGRELSARPSTPVALRAVVRLLAAETSMDRVWITLGNAPAGRVVADTGDAAPPTPGLVSLLDRSAGDDRAEWLRIHRPRLGARPLAGTLAYRVRITSGDDVLGSISALRDPGARMPGPSETRLLAAAADHVAQTLTLDHLAIGSQAGEIARQSDALRSALLQSVSHDLRTPLATIRAAAGTLRSGDTLSSEDRRESADAIEREVDYLNRIVTNLLDLSRIEAGALRAASEIVELDDIVGRTVDRLRPRLAGRSLELCLAVPPVRIDPMLLDGAVTNVLENAIKHTPPSTTVVVEAHAVDEGTVRLVIEDDGPGVPDGSLSRLFDRFYRVPGRSGGSRAGTGIGLAVARGLVEAMGGHVRARPSDRGGLAVEFDLPAAEMPDGAGMVAS